MSPVCPKHKPLLIALLLSTNYRDVHKDKSPGAKNRTTHHDDQENIMEVLPVAESVGEEKCKVSLQQL